MFLKPIDGRTVELENHIPNNVISAELKIRAIRTDNSAVAESTFRGKLDELEILHQ